MSLRSNACVMRNSFLVMTLWIQEEIVSTAFIFVGFFLRAQSSYDFNDTFDTGGIQDNMRRGI